MFTLMGMLLDTAVGIIIGVLALIGVFIYLYGQIRLFTKCGQEWWKAIIPFYNDYIFTVKICGLHWGWYVGILASSLLLANDQGIAVLLRFFVKGMCYYNLATRCSKDPIPSMIFGALFPEAVCVYYGLNNAYYDPFIEVKQSGLF